MTLRAILFDMDGVLVDATEIHRRAFSEAFVDVTGNNLPLGSDVRLEGRPTKTKIKMLGVDPSSELGLEIQTHKQRLTMCEAKRYPMDLKMIALMERIPRTTRIGVYTNSIKETATAFLKAAGVYCFVDVLCTNEDVSEPKPSPEGYQKLMLSLGVEPQETLIVEDSDVGFAAAWASGAKVLRVRSPEDLRQL